jgi:hypothetical protein
MLAVSSDHPLSGKSYPDRDAFSQAHHPVAHTAVIETRKASSIFASAALEGLGK